MKIYTIGHSNLDRETLVSILQEHGISWVADVRSSPYSGRLPQFNRRSFVAALKAADIRYLFLGDKIGGRPTNGESGEDWTQGQLNSTLVSGLSSTTRWSEGMTLLCATIRILDTQGKIGCILCSEGDPNNCHRSLISFELEQIIPGLVVQHIRPHGTASGETRFQKSLFITPLPNDRRIDH